MNARALLMALSMAVATAAGNALMASRLAAQEVNIGGPATGTNALPFSFYHSQSNNRYQQVYGADKFANGPVMIDAMRFYNSKSIAGGLPGTIAEGNYLIRFGYSNRAVNGLTTNFDANVNSPLATFHDGLFGANSLRIAGTSFLYNPMLGNLVLDIIVRAQADVGFLGLDYSNSAVDGTSRAYNTVGLPGIPSVAAADNFGLITTFETRAATVVPEPSTVALMAAGLVVLGALGRRRATASRETH